MEKLVFHLPATERVEKIAHVGVVGSGDLEVMIEPTDGNETVIEVRTGITGFKEIWEKVLERFIQQQNILAKISINDFGATPGVVSIRLAQAVEVSKDA